MGWTMSSNDKLAFDMLDHGLLCDDLIHLCSSLLEMIIYPDKSHEK